MIVTDAEHLEDVVGHLTELHDCAVKMAKKLMAAGQTQFALKLLERAFKHDTDKFKPFLWEHLRKGAEGPEFEEAKRRHNAKQRHHPEFHGTIHEMDDLDVAEMVLDWGARAAHFKTSLQDYIDDKAVVRYGFTKKDAVYKKIMYYKSLLCEPEFAHVEKKAS